MHDNILSISLDIMLPCINIIIITQFIVYQFLKGVVHLLLQSIACVGESSDRFLGQGVLNHLLWHGRVCHYTLGGLGGFLE